MSSGRQKRGATALLFDRLLGKDGDGDALPLPSARKTYGKAELHASINEQLTWLLNTRVPIDYQTLDARTLAGTRSTIDYGLPDLTIYPVGDTSAMARLCRHIAQTIALYEPRLLNPSAATAGSSRRGDTLTIEITGEVRVGLITEPVSFAIDIAIEEGARHGH